MTFSRRAVDVIQKRETKVASWYLDMNMVANYWSDQSRAYHHTAPINMNYGLHEALRIAGGVKKRAAQLVGVSFRSFRYRLEKLGLDESPRDE